MATPTPQADEKVCPYCAEIIKAAAVKCRYCQSDLGEAPAATSVVADRVPQDAPASEDPILDEDDALATEPPDRVPFLASARLLAMLVALCLVLVAVAGFAWWRSENPDDGKAPDGAITSSGARDAGMTAAARLTQQVLSYDWKTLDEDVKASQAVLAPSFRAEYAKTMDGVKAQTVKNQVELTASVVSTSIVSATEKKVEALLFVNQVTKAKGPGNQRLDQSRVLVTLTRDAGEWRVSKMDAF